MKIPDDRKPSYEVTINGVKNFFAPGTEVSGDVASALFGTETFPPAPPETDKPFNIPIPAPGSTVSANPTLAGTEDSLTGLEIDGTKYKVGGGGGGVFIVHSTVNEAGTGEVLDKTWQEIKDATATSVVVRYEEEVDEFSYLVACSHLAGFGGESWNAVFFAVGEVYRFTTTEGANAYPVMIYE